MTQGLNLPEANDANMVPRAIVSKSGSRTLLQLPQHVFDRCKTPNGGRTYNFFTNPGDVHEGEEVIIFSIPGGEEQRGTVQRAQQWPPGKWFVQTPMHHPRGEGNHVDDMVLV